MSQETIPDSGAGDPGVEKSRPGFTAFEPKEPRQHSDWDLEQPVVRFSEQSYFPLHSGDRRADESRMNAQPSSEPGHSLFQDMFFFCTIRKLADLPGSGRIYVEIVVDRDTGVAFAKIYSSKSAMNAVDILASRVLPFFRRQALIIKEIHTPDTAEYCGLPPVHTYEAFLAAAHIRHLPIEHARHSSNFLCQEFYRYLLNNFFPDALRRNFPMSLRDLQNDLDTFVKAHNAEPIGRPML